MADGTNCRAENGGKYPDENTVVCYRRLLSSLGGRLACCHNGSNFVVVAKVEVEVGAAVTVAFEVEVETGSGDRR